MPINQAKVKSVLSGDTLILASVNNPAQERTLSLAYVSAPRLKRDGDEVSQALDLVQQQLKSSAAFCVPFPRLPPSYDGR